jgi:TRAP-type C4-dicarboxylate transport system permease large subunit
VLASYTSLPVSGLFLAGIIPALVLAVGLVVVIAVKSHREQPGEHLSSLEEDDVRWWRLIGLGIPALSIPVILLVGILGGIGTPTEISSFAVVAGLVATLAIAIWAATTRRGRGGTASPVGQFAEAGRDNYTAAERAASLSGMVLMIIATATAFEWALAISGVPQSLANLVTSLNGTTYLFMIGAIVIMIVLGAFLEGLPALLLLTPILLPVAVAAGVSELQFGIVLLIAMGLGAFLPPVGVGAYVACSVTGANIEGTFRRFVPYLAVLVVGLVLIGLIPPLTLWLPAK